MVSCIQKRSEYLLQSASSCSGRLHKKIKNCERLIRRYKLDIENFNRDLKCNQRKIAIGKLFLIFEINNAIKM